MSSRIEKLRSALETQLQPLSLEIFDDSAAHAGHAGAAASGGGHFRVHIVAEKFSGRPLIARHRMVYDALAAQMGGEIHALSITARTPEELTTLTR
jgi:BolA protein